MLTGILGAWVGPAIVLGALYAVFALAMTYEPVSDAFIAMLGGDKDIHIFSRIIAFELTVAAVTVPLALFGCCWYAGSRRFALGARWACPLFYVVAYLLVFGQHGLAGPFLPDSIHTVAVPAVAAFFGGWLGDRQRRLREDAAD